MSSPKFPEPPVSGVETSLEEADRMVQAVHAKKQAWTQVPIKARIKLLRRCMDSTYAARKEWCSVGGQAKGGTPGSAIAAEVLIGGVTTTLRNMRLLIRALEADGKPTLPQRRKTADGQEIVRVYPTDTWDSLLFRGFVGETWITPGQTASQGAIYRSKRAGEASEGAVSLVLGAGNVSSIGPMDALHKLFVEDEVVVLKTNPVNSYLGPIWEKALQPLIEEGVLCIVNGGAQLGKHLCEHALVDTIHMTGSDSTHDAIVWGVDGEAAEQRRAAGDAINTRPITSELGCVTPLLIVPGPWSEADIDYHARHVAGMVSHNASFNCTACKVLVLPGKWALRDAFVAKVREHLAMTEPRKAYYPGSQARYAKFVEAHPNAIPLTEASDEIVPWTVLPDVKAESGEYALTHEAFCGVLAEVDLDVEDPAEFLEAAVAFANEKVWGTLSCMITIHPKTEKAHRETLDKAIADLRYGGIAVNAWSGVNYGFVSTTWGAFPGHTREEIVSGSGSVHNTYLLDHPEKSVIRAPFRIKPTPVWFSDHKNLFNVAEAATAMEYRPSLFRFLALAKEALQG